MKPPPKLTCLLFVFNEAASVAATLRHAVQWADEVLVLDKQSADHTRAICAEFGPTVRCLETPYMPAGSDDLVSACRLAAHDWIWLGSASELPTRKLVAEARALLADQPDLDLVYIPRKLYFMGMEPGNDAWGIRSDPVLVNRRRAVITNTSRNHFHPQNPANTARIPFAADCCVHDYTATTVGTCLSELGHRLETDGGQPTANELIQEALGQLDQRGDLRSLAGRETFGLECITRIRWLGMALHGWDKRRTENLPETDQTARDAMLGREWPPPATPAATGNLPGPVAGPAPPIIVLDAVEAACLKAGGQDQLLAALRGRPISRLIRTLYQVGAHRFQEKALLFEIFPNLERVILFEPLPELFAQLRAQEQDDPRISVLPYAISDRNGETTFHVANNDGASSSLLPFGQHRHLFPQVQTTEQIKVQTRTLDTAVDAHQLPPPDFLFLDVQGAEHQILASLSPVLRHRLRIIYTEASTVEIYAGSRLLKDVEAVLAGDFSFAGYCPLKERIPSHGNALFVNLNQAWLLLPAGPPGSAAQAPIATPRQRFWARTLRRALPWKLRRSLRKRLAAISQALAS